MEVKTLELLERGLISLDIYYREGALEKLKKYVSLYMSYNERVNLSSIRDEEGVVIRHILDSASILKTCALEGIEVYGRRSIDLGSGAGFPGIVLKILGDGSGLGFRMDLAEVSKKKNRFLEQVLKELELDDVGLVDSSAVRVSRDYDILYSRAFGSLSKIIKEGKRYVKGGGLLLCYKSRKAFEELDSLEMGVQRRCRVLEVLVPYLAEERQIVVIEV